MDAAVTTLKFESKAVIPTDPRTKLFLTVTVSTIMITGGTGGFMNLVRPCLMACPIVFLLLSRKWVAAARFAVTYAILFALELTVLPLLTGTWNFILGAAVGIYTHMLPGFIMGYVSRMFLTRDTFFASLVSSYGQEYVDTLMSYTPDWTYPVLFVVTFIGGILGALLGKAVLKKHFEKAGIA